MDFILICILIMAFLYASVGHGGASGYHAVMALFAVEVILMKSTALTLNIFVAGISFYYYWKAGYFKWKLFIPFAIGSIPLAYLGGTLEIQEAIYKTILAVFLVFAIIKMLGIITNEKKNIRKLPFLVGITFGGLLGFVSGLIGIGGGIILSPILLLFRWAKIKEAAAVSALFIFVNSLSGLTGIISAGNYKPIQGIWLWIIIAIIGGSLGSYMGSKKMTNKGVKYLLVLVLSFACIKLLLSSF